MRLHLPNLRFRHSLALLPLLILPACAEDDEVVGGSEDGPYYVLALGEGAKTDGTSKITVTVPAGAESLALVVEGAGKRLILADTITNPAGEKVFDYNNDITKNRADPLDRLYTVLVPNNPEVKLTEGEWGFTFVTEGNPYDITARAVIKNSTAGKTLDLNLFFVGLEETTAESAKDDTDFQQILTNVEAIYAQAGISVGTVSYNALTEEQADTFAVIDHSAGQQHALYKLSSGMKNRALNYFFVADIEGGDAGFSLLGEAGGVPGPPTLHGTERSGVMVNMANFEAAKEAGDAELLSKASRLTEIIMAHEGGHFLGLYHTVERNGLTLKEGINGQDPLSDTALCPDSADANDNKVLSATECDGQGGGNLMFWSPTNDSRDLSSHQQTVLVKNAIIQ